MKKSVNFRRFIPVFEKQKRDDPSFTGDWEQIFVYRSNYISNVLAYALMSVQYYKDIDKLQEYVIIFEEKDKEEMRIAKRYLLKKTAFKVKFWCDKEK